MRRPGHGRRVRPPAAPHRARPRPLQGNDGRDSPRVRSGKRRAGLPPRPFRETTGGIPLLAPRTPRASDASRLGHLVPRRAMVLTQGRARRGERDMPPRPTATILGAAAPAVPGVPASRACPPRPGRAGRGPGVPAEARACRARPGRAGRGPGRGGGPRWGHLDRPGGRRRPHRCRAGVGRQVPHAGDHGARRGAQHRDERGRTSPTRRSSVRSTAATGRRWAAAAPMSGPVRASVRSRWGARPGCAGRVCGPGVRAGEGRDPGARPGRRRRPERPVPRVDEAVPHPRGPAVPSHGAGGVQSGSRPLRPTARSSSGASSRTGTTGPKMPPPRSPCAAAASRKACEARSAAGSGA